MEDLLGVFLGIVLILICIVITMIVMLFIAKVDKEDLQESNTNKLDISVKPRSKKTLVDKTLVDITPQKPVEVLSKPKRTYNRKPKE